MSQVKNIVFFWIVFVLALLGFSTTPPVFAQPWEVILEESNQFPDGQQYGMVSVNYIYDGDKRGVEITVTVNENIIFSSSDFGVQNFSFNTTIINPEANLILGLPEDWAAQYEPFKLSEFGRFHITVAAEDSPPVSPLVIAIFHATDHLSYTDFTVANRNNRLFAAHITSSSYASSNNLDLYYATEENPTISCVSTTTTTKKPTTTTTKKPTTTTTKKPTTTSSLPTSTSTSQPTTTSSLPTSTSTSQPTTTSSLPTSTTTSQPTTTSSLPTSTTTSQFTTTSSLPSTTSTIGPCIGEIALGRDCPGETIDGRSYNRPGRRGLAATCGDIIDFTVCSDCGPIDPSCLEWTITPDDTFLTIIQVDECCWRLIIDDTCELLEDIKVFEITVADICDGWSDSVIVEIGKVVIDIDDTATKRVSDSFEVAVNLINPDHHVKALSTDICECDGGDRLQCTGCTIDPLRAFDFTCSATEQADGCCRVVLYSTNPATLILQGSGPALNLLYSHTGETEDCVCLSSLNTQVSDQFNEQLCACQLDGEVCFDSCGDLYPQDCIGESCGDAGCGDGVVDLFDILEAIDIILGLQTATPCQLERGNVPNGMPPYCGDPAGAPNCNRDTDLDMLDVLVIMDAAQGKNNCCEYCLLRE